MKNIIQTPQRYRGHLLTAHGQQRLQRRLEQIERQTAIRQNPTSIAERVQLHTPEGIHAATVRKILRGTTGVDKRSIERMFKALGLTLTPDDSVHAHLYHAHLETKPLPSRKQVTVEKQVTAGQRGISADRPISPWPVSPWPVSPWEKPHPVLRDWGNAVDVPKFCGRQNEIKLLSTQIVDNQARLVALLGIPGVGKTALAIKLAQTIEGQFDGIIWRSLRYAPSLKELLQDILGALMQTSDLPESLSQLMTLILNQFKQHRCLLVLDQVESLLQAHQLAGTYQASYEPYGEFFKALLEVPHQSCTLLTSREGLQALHCLKHSKWVVHPLDGLMADTSQRHLDPDGYFANHPVAWQLLSDYYAGNPMALRMAVAQIGNFLDDHVSDSLQALSTGEFLVGPFQDAIAHQLNRLTFKEQIILSTAVDLSIEVSSGVSLLQLKKAIPDLEMRRQLLALLDSLIARSLIETQKPSFHHTRFKVHPIVYRYLKAQRADRSTGVTYLKAA